MGIDWAAFTWEAFATLATGGIAVVAAYRVGKRQADIQATQAALQEIELRSALFDKRFRVYEATHAYLAFILREAQPPDAATEGELLRASKEARFLFSKSVYDEIDLIWKKAIDYHAIKRQIEAHFQRLGRHDQQLLNKELEAFSWFSEKFKDLPSIFDQMHLDPSHK